MKKIVSFLVLLLSILTLSQASFGSGEIPSEDMRNSKRCLATRDPSFLFCFFQKIENSDGVVLYESPSFFQIDESGKFLKQHGLDGNPWVGDYREACTFANMKPVLLESFAPPEVGLEDLSFTGSFITFGTNGRITKIAEIQNPRYHVNRISCLK